MWFPIQKQALGQNSTRVELVRDEGQASPSSSILVPQGWVWRAVRMTQPPTQGHRGSVPWGRTVLGMAQCRMPSPFVHTPHHLPFSCPGGASQQTGAPMGLQWYLLHTRRMLHCGLPVLPATDPQLRPEQDGYGIFR